jgi:hypothetical protein
MIDGAFIRRVAALLLVPIIIVACSIPADDTVDLINDDDLRGLQNTTTTTSTTTTIAPTTLEPPGSTDATATTVSTAPATTQATRTMPMTVYYTLGTTDTMVPLRRDLPDTSLQQVVNELQTPVADLASYGLQSWVREGLIVGTTLSRGTLDVSFNRAVFDSMSDTQKRRAIAQIVLSFTVFTTADAGSVAFVRLLFSDGEGISVPLPETGTSTEPGAPLNFEDFRSLIASTTGPTTSTVTTTTLPTEPPDTTSPTDAAGDQ